MKFTSKIKMNLPFLKVKKTLIYNTFQKATWDVYFVTSIFKNASSEVDAEIYLTELVEDGSLKEHFFSIFKKIKEMNEETINRILDSSLFPIQRVNKDYSIKSYLYLNLLILEKQGRPYKILNPGYDEKQEMEVLLNENETFVEVTSDLEELVSISKSYEIFVESNKLSIKVLDNWYEIKENDFKKSLDNKCENINRFLGLIEINPEGSEWKLLNTNILDSFLTSLGFYDKKNWYMVEPEYWQELIITKVFGDIYFYKLNRIMFSKNEILVEKTLAYLVENQKYDEIKTKTWLALFPYTNNYDLVQKIINDILNKKDSKEISLHALKLVMQGLTVNWSKKALEKMKNYSEEIKQYQELYKIDNSLFNFQGDKEIIWQFPEDILSNDHANEIKKYKQDLENIHKSIKEIIGEMASSGVRENLKKLPLNEKNKKVKKGLNKIVGHNKNLYASMNLEKLKEEYQKLNNFYHNDYLTVKKMIDEKKTINNN